MSELSNENWISIKKVGLPKLEEISTTNFSSIYKSKEVLIQTKRGERFVAYCRKEVYENKKWNDEIEWFSYGTGGRRMKVMSKVIAWMELPDKYEEENKKYDAALQEYRKNNISDWELSNYGSDMEVLGIKNYICRDTLYGDWSCTTYNSDTHEKIGEFCADAGMVGVFLLDEVLKYNPDFNYHIERPWTTTLIKDFDGEIDFEIIHTEGVYENDTEFYSKGEKWEDNSVSVIGRGNINFETRQTGF